MTKDFKVIGYAASWQPDAGNVHYDKLTHINYAFAIPTADGGLRPLDNPALARELVEKGHANGVKIMISVGGWEYQNVPLAQTFIDGTDTPEKIEKLADAIVALVEEYDFDGADIDWEHPRISDGSYKPYEALICTLSPKLHAKGKLLSCAIIGGVDPAGRTGRTDLNGVPITDTSDGLTDRALKEFDFINIMCYDGGTGEYHSPYSYAELSGAYWRDARSIPGEKLTLGVPFYGRPGGAYKNILAAVPEAYKSDTCMVDGAMAYYNGVPTIRRKTRYAMENLGGVMIWELSEDVSDPATSLLCAIHDELGK